MIVYIKNSNGVRQLGDINEIARRGENELAGIYEYVDCDNSVCHEIVWTIKNINAEKYYGRIQRALDNHKDNIMLHIHDDKGVMIECLR